MNEPLMTEAEIKRYMMIRFILKDKSSFPIGPECQYLLTSGMLVYNEEDKFIVTEDGHRYYKFLEDKVRLVKPEILN